MTPRLVVTLLQAVSFVVLAGLLWHDGQLRLAAAQALLACITVLVYV